MRTYSYFFKTLHDETNPTGYLGRGAHYSVLRAVVFHDPMGKPLPEGQIADFAVIWDEDHDIRVMEPIEEIYRRGHLASFLMFGEHRGFFTAIRSNELLFAFPFNIALRHRVDELEFSVRTDNCLKNDNIVFIGDLVQKTESEMLRMPNFGRKSLNEIKPVLAQMGLHLGMEVPGWPPENIEDLAENIEGLAEQMARVSFLQREINAICQALNDPWPSKVVALGSAENPIISDDDEKVSLYLKNLEMLWQLGIGAKQIQKAVSLASDNDRRIIGPAPSVPPWPRVSVRPQQPPIDADANLTG